MLRERERERERGQESVSRVKSVCESVCSMLGRVTLLCCLSLLLSSGPVTSLKCYSDLDGVETSLCEEKRGYRTCFIKYNQSK